MTNKIADHIIIIYIMILAGGANVNDIIESEDPIMFCDCRLCTLGGSFESANKADLDAKKLINKYMVV